MTVISDKGIRIRSQRPDAMTYRIEKDPLDLSKTIITDVTFYSANKDQTIAELLTKLEKSIDDYHFSSLGVKTLEELLNNYPEENREAAKDAHSSMFYNVKHISDEDNIDSFWQPMISPFVSESIKKLEDGRKIPSFGSSSYSYDIRIGRNFKMFKPNSRKLDEDLPIIDSAAENPTDGLMEELKDQDYIIIPPRGFALGHSVEYIKMPRDLLAVCMAKSSIARMGIVAHVTPLEPEWEGYITIEISNNTDYPFKLHAGIGIMALIFLQGNEVCETSYKDRGGKYQLQPALPIETVN